MLAAICRGEMKAWQELMREEDIWPGVTFKWVWCDVHPRCIEASPAEDNLSQLFGCQRWIYDRLAGVTQTSCG